MKIPIELKVAAKTAETTWKLRLEIEADPAATPEQKQDAVTKANECDRDYQEWYARWEKLGGGADIESIIIEENYRQVKLLKIERRLSL